MFFDYVLERLSCVALVKDDWVECRIDDMGAISLHAHLFMFWHWRLWRDRFECEYELISGFHWASDHVFGDWDRIAFFWFVSIGEADRFNVCCRIGIRWFHDKGSISLTDFDLNGVCGRVVVHAR